MTESDAARVSPEPRRESVVAALARRAGHAAVVLALVPLALAMLVVVGLLDLVSLIAVVGRRPPANRVRHSRRREVSIIIVSYNGRELLARCLPSVETAVDAEGGDHEIIVVDNGSEDGTVEWLARKWPAVKVVALERNHFFGGGNRAGVKVATKDILVFLNNDMVVEEGFLGPLLDGFEEDDVFAVSAQIFFPEGARRREETGKTRGRWRLGELQLSHDEITAIDERRGQVPVFWAGGGSAAFDRRLFLEFGQFEGLYDPFYLEDTGLSYQAWKRGYRVLFAPASRVLHEHRATGRKFFGERLIERTTRRNYYLFLWRNITGLSETVQQFLFLPQRFAKAARRRDWRLESGALMLALLRWPQAIWLRERDRRHYVRSDREIHRLASSYAEYDARFGRRRAGRLRILMLLGRLPKRRTDGSWILFNLIRRLGERHDVTVLSFIDSEGERPHAEELRPYCADLELVLRKQNYAFPNPHRMVPRRLAVDYTDPAMLERIQAHLDGGDFDVFQCEYLEMAHMMPDLSRLPSVFTHHEVLALAASRHLRRAASPWGAARALMETARYLRYELEVARRFRRVVTLSDVDAEYLRGYRPSLPVRTISSGVCLEEADRELAREVAEEAIVVFVGYYLHPPNVDAAMFLAREIFPKVREAVPEARCLLVGKNPTPEVKALEREDAAVTVTGFVAELAPLMARAAVVAIPIRTGAGLRGKFLEAWAHRKAVVATSVAAQGFRAVPGRDYLEADDPAELARLIAELLRDERRRRALGQAGRELVERRYSDVAMANAYEALYGEIGVEVGPTDGESSSVPGNRSPATLEISTPGGGR